MGYKLVLDATDFYCMDKNISIFGGKKQNMNVSKWQQN